MILKGFTLVLTSRAINIMWIISWVWEWWTIAVLEKICVRFEIFMEERKHVHFFFFFFFFFFGKPTRKSIESCVYFTEFLGFRFWKRVPIGNYLPGDEPYQIQNTFDKFQSTDFAVLKRMAYDVKLQVLPLSTRQVQTSNRVNDPGFTMFYCHRKQAPSKPLLFRRSSSDISPDTISDWGFIADALTEGRDDHYHPF